MKKYIIAKQHSCVEYSLLGCNLQKKIKEKVKNGLWAEELKDYSYYHFLDEQIEALCDGRQIVFDKETGLYFSTYNETHIEVSKNPRKCVVLKQYVCAEFQYLPKDIKEKARKNLLNILKKDKVDDLINDNEFINDYCKGYNLVFDIETGTPIALDDKLCVITTIDIQTITVKGENSWKL